MAFPGEGILTELVKRLEDKTIKEFKYFRDFEDHVHDFVVEHNSLVAKQNKLQNDIEDAKRRNENQIEDDIQNWIHEAGNLIQKNTKIKQTWSSGWCPYWKYQQGKMLAQRTLAIRDHIQRCNFDRIARPAELPGIEYHASSRDFIDFESRKTEFKQLVEYLEEGIRYMIGLQGMGGTGKTTLATQVGKKVEESKAFQKVIFVVVSKPPDVNKIRGDIARQLGLPLKEREEAEHSEFLWSRISNDNKKKILIILDDVWEELDLREIGIPFGADNKNCYVLITTRDSKVCRAMKCQQIVRLDTLGDEDALKLFQFHVRSGDNGSSSNDLEGLTRALVKECGGLPITIVVLASTLRNWSFEEWNVALTTLRSSKTIVGVHQDLMKVYACLRYSYDNLKDGKAKKLFLLCSIFPEDYEISTNLIIRLGIGSGIFGEVDGYCAARSQPLGVKNELIASSLLLKVEKKECVKMHDLVRKVAQWIAKEDIQVIIHSRTTLEANKRFVFWSIEDFPDQIDDTKLEILLLWISGNDLVKDPNTFFAGMSRLKILFLRGQYGRKVPSSLLLQSLVLLKNIRTLILDSWKLGDISVLKNLRSLVTLELENCLIIELPNLKEIKKLRLLGLRKCEIQKKNPFEMIERCLQLEELYFVKNYYVNDWKPEDDLEIDDEIAHDISPLQLQMYSVACSGFKRFANGDNGLLKCFNSEHMRHLVSGAMFKYLVGRAQVLELGKLGETRWKNLIPDIISVEDGCTDNLIKLYLYEWDDIECLVDTNKYHYLNKEVFLKVVELHMYSVNVKELYWGDMPTGFLMQLQILKLEKCRKLQNIFSDKNIKLPHLKILEVIDCPLFQPSIFQPSVARGLVQLEELVIDGCKELKSLIAYASLEEEMMIDDSDHKKYGLLFPELKSLQIRRCDKLEMVSPLFLDGDLPKLKDLYIEYCGNLKYIFGENRVLGHVLQQKRMLPSQTNVLLHEVPSFVNVFQKCNRKAPQVSKEDSKGKCENSKTSAFSWALGCCYKASTNVTLEDHTISKESSALSSKRIETFYTAECLIRQPSSLQNLRKMRLYGIVDLKSLFSLSIATTVMIMLEELYIKECEELKHIITNEAEDDSHLIECTSVFPKLQWLTINTCNKLEFIFPSNLSGALPELKSIHIYRANNLKYAFGKRFDLPALESVSLRWVPNIISIDLETVESPKESRASSESIETFHTAGCFIRQTLSLRNIREMRLWRCSNIKSLFNVSIAKTMIMLENLDIRGCEELKHIIAAEEEDDDHLNVTSIFPRLQMLQVMFCNKLEFIFPFTFSGALPKLKSIEIEGAYDLKYVFGRYVDLPALESIFLMWVPSVISIGLETVEAQEEIKEHMVNVTSEAENESEIQEIVDVETPLIPCVGFLYVLNFHNLSLIRIRENRKLKTLFSISACRNLRQLSKLHIISCEELVNVVEDDSNEHQRMNYSSIFPKLEDLSIWNCNKLEFIFPFSLFGSLQKLRTLGIMRAAELRCIFGKYDDRGYLSSENESDGGLHIHLPSVEALRFVDVPKMTNICAKKYHVSFPPLQRVALENLQDLNGSSFPDWMAYLQGIRLNAKAPKDLMKMIKNVQRLAEITIRDSNIEEVFNLEGMEIKVPVMTLSLKEMCLGNLKELRHICKGPRYILSLPSLQTLEITACEKLRSIFSVSIVESLPQLSKLRIKECNGLVDIIEESAEDHFHQLCFPKLEKINIKCCNSLKRLFSVSTCDMFPKLKVLEIEDASELEQVFICKQDDMKMMAPIMEELFPQLLELKLRKLPKLVTISEGIDFQATKLIHVNDCPKYREMSQIQEWHENEDSENLAAISALLDFAEGLQVEAMKRSVEEVASSMMSKEETVKEMEDKDPTLALEKQARKGSTAKPQLTMTSQHRKEETLIKIIAAGGEPSTTLDHQESETSSSESQLRNPYLHSTCEATLVSQLQDLGEAKTSSEVHHKTKMPLYDDDDSIDVIVKERVQESPSSKDVMLETLLADLAPKNSSAASIPTPQEDFPLDLTKKETRSGTVMTKQQTLTEKTSISVGNIPEHTTIMKTKTGASFVYSKAEGSQSCPASMRVESIQIQEETTTMEAKTDTMICRETEEKVGKAVLALPTPTSSTSLDLDETTKETRDGNVQDGPKSEKSKMANIPMEDKRSLPDVIPSSHHHSEAGATGSSSPTLEIGQILELMELKDGELPLLTKALKLYPQLRMSHGGERTRPIIAFCYRVLIDILVLLATKTPRTITTSDKSTLEENLGAATYLGLDKEWVESVRSKVFGKDVFGVTAVEEEIQVMKAELETCEIKLEQVRKKKVEIKERIEGAISVLEMVKSESEETDSELWCLLEDRERLRKKMMEFRGIISAQDTPYGI